MAEILLHTEKITEDTRQRLLCADVIPVRVKNMDSFKLLSAEHHLLEGDDIMLGAIDALSTDLSHGDPRLNRFITNMATMAKTNRAEKKKKEQP